MTEFAAFTSIRPCQPTAAVACAVLLTALSCREHLPAYEEPTNLFSPKVLAALVYRSDQTAIYVSFVLVNRFDETLDGIADVDGTISVSLLRDPSTVRTFVLDATHLSARGYEPVSKRLRLDPGESVTLQVRYDFRDDSGRDLIASYLELRQDPSCPSRAVTGPEIYDIRASVRLFPRTQFTVAPPLSYVLCLPVPFVDDRVCLGPKGDHPETALCP
ncbi:MAG: hypothetical protein MUE68_06555 [Bacteroidetes bacterium]|jgi:hypothetical protein|nr:hypothetical protein [Bacteroidota bacterium]